MDKETIFNLAIMYLRKKNVNFLEPGELGRLDGDRQEVIFLDPISLDQNVAIVEPGDLRVWVNVRTKEVTWIDQM